MPPYLQYFFLINMPLHASWVTLTICVICHLPRQMVSQKYVSNNFLASYLDIYANIFCTRYVLRFLSVCLSRYIMFFFQCQNKAQDFGKPVSDYVFLSVQNCCDLSWLAVLGFNATLTAKVISWRSVTHMYFLAF